MELLRRICNWGARKIKVNGEYIKGLSFTIEMVKNVDNEKTGYLTPKQRGDLIKATYEYPDKQTGNLVLFLFYTGCRKGEALGLKWSNIKWDEGIIEFLETKAGVKQHIPLTETVVEFLKNHP